MNGFILAYISLKRRPLSSLIAVLAIALPLAAAGVTASAQFSSRQALERYDHSVDAVVGPKNGGLELLLGGMFFVGREELVIPAMIGRYIMERKKTLALQMTPIVEFAEYKDYKIISTDNTFIQRPGDAKPPKAARGEWISGDGQAVLGAEAARRERLNVGDEIIGRSYLLDPSDGKPLWERSLKIVGVLDKTQTAFDLGIYTGMSEIIELQQKAVSLGLMRDFKGEQAVTFFLVWVIPGQEKALIDFVDNHTVAQTVFVKEEMTVLNRLVGGGFRAAAMVYGALILMGVFCVTALLNARFEAMSEDLAVLRALGYQRSRIGAWLCWEGIFLGLASLPVAIALQGVGIHVLNYIKLVSFYYGSLIWPLKQMALLWGLALLGCLAAVVIPMIRLYRHNIHEALKGL